MPSSQQAYTLYPKGSEWRKWDLHVHTPASIRNGYGGDQDEVWERYISDLEALPEDFKVLGINDYWFLDGYERLLCEKKRGRLQNIDLLLPVIEFRIDKLSGVDFYKNNNIDMHIIFSNDLSPEEIKAQFLNRLSAEFKLSTGNTCDWNGVITSESLVDIGRKIRESTPQDKQQNLPSSNKILGFNNLAISTDKLNEILDTSTYLQGKFITCIGKAEWDSLKWTSASTATKKSLINSVDIVFTSSPSIEQYYKAKETLKNQGVNDLLLDCSDSHHFSNSSDKDRIGNCHTWIKADPTFEGLKQVIHEPTGRVKIQELSPDDKASHNVIEKIVINNENIANNVINFNPDLNVIIGGRSSGKSALLAGLASNLCGLDEIQSEDYKKYIQNAFSKGMSVYFKGLDTPYERQENSNERIEYFPQNKFSELAKNQKDFDEVVEKIVQKDPSYQLIEKYNNIDIPELRNKIRALLDKYRQLRSSINECQQYIKEKPTLKDLHAQQEELETKSKTFGSEVISDSERALYDQKIKEKNDLTKNLGELEALKGALNSLQEDPMVDVSALVGKIHKINYTKFKVTLEHKLTELIEGFKTDWIQNLSELETSRAEKCSELLNKIKEIDENTELLSIIQKLSKNNETEKIIKEIGNVDRAITDIQTLGIKLNKYETEFRSTEKEIKKTFMQFFQKTKELEESFSLIPSASSNTDNSLKITTKLIHKYDDNLKSYITNKCDQRKLNSRIETIIEGELSASRIHKKLNEIIKTIINDPGILRSSYGLEDFLDGILTNPWFTYHYNVGYEGDSFHEMSEGKKSFVILKLILEFSNKKVPLLIDQPEDDLDNRAIFTELVAYLKEKKLERQIILVTHNANIVVNADSELVIVANQHGTNSPNTDGKQFEYIQGSIEHSFPKVDTEFRVLYSQGIREHVCEIMKGGTEAFKRRERRYNIR